MKVTITFGDKAQPVGSPTPTGNVFDFLQRIQTQLSLFGHKRTGWLIAVALVPYTPTVYKTLGEMLHSCRSLIVWALPLGPICFRTPGAVPPNNSGHRGTL